MSGSATKTASKDAPVNSSHATGKVRRPADYEPHERTWMIFPHRADIYRHRMAAVQAEHAQIVAAISQFEPVTVLAHPDHVEAARKSVGNTAEVIEMRVDDYWTRDCGPSFVIGADGKLEAVNWVFTAWGGKHAPFDQDNLVAPRVAAREGVKVRDSWLVTEGGSLACDGEGTLIVTETSILNPNRNPGVNKFLAEHELKAMLGVDKVIWLPGDPLDIETDGHVDAILAFVAPGKVLFEYNPDPNDPHGRILSANLEVLRGETDAKGRPFEVLMMPEAHEAERTTDVFCASYINYYLCNGGVIVPGYGVATDAEAVRILQEAYPDRKVVQVQVPGIAAGGGAIHCITQEQPKIFA